MTNRAFLVGINAYPGQPLHGCVNDVTDMANFLVAACGFKSAQIRLLVDRRATKAAIAQRLKWLVAGAKKGDRLLFHYSGHGTQFPIRDDNGEVTSLHDAICPVDFDWSREHAIIDEDLRTAFDGVPAGTELVFVSDSCNSGDLTRAFRVNPPRFLVPPADIEWRAKTARDIGLKAAPLQHDRCGLISGCRSDQESADAMINGRPNGALTYYLLQVLKGTGGLSKPLSQVAPDVTELLKQNSYDQEPQVRGPADVTGRGFLKAAS